MSVDFFKMVGNITSNDVIICLQGGPGMNHSYLRESLSILEEKFSLIYYEYQKQPPLELTDLVCELKNIVESIKSSKRVHLLAHSFGSVLAIEFLSEYPQMITSNMFISWIYNSNWFKKSEIKRKYLIEEIRKSVPEINLGNDLNTRAMKDFLSFSRLYFNEDFLSEGENLLRNAKYRGDIFYHLMERYLLDFDLSRQLKEITVPTLSIAGAEDGVVDIDYIEEGILENRFIESVVVEGAGHFPFLEKNKFVNEAIIGFIAANRRLLK